tara:strand:- start:680 stop:1096 length:417 start_codon:yes stop_codon:yes gene_type:complete
MILKKFDEISVRVYYEDTDAGGIVYHTKYLNFAERARTEFLRKRNLEQHSVYTKFGIYFIVKSIDISYLKVSYLDDLLKIKTTIIALNRAKVNFFQLITNNNTNIAKIKVTVCCINKNRKVARMNDALYHVFRDFERK